MRDIFIANCTSAPRPLGCNFSYGVTKSHCVRSTIAVNKGDKDFIKNQTPFSI